MPFNLVVVGCDLPAPAKLDSRLSIVPIGDAPFDLNVQVASRIEKTGLGPDDAAD